MKLVQLGDSAEIHNIFQEDINLVPWQEAPVNTQQQMVNSECVRIRSTVWQWHSPSCSILLHNIELGQRPSYLGRSPSWVCDRYSCPGPTLRRRLCTWGLMLCYHRKILNTLSLHLCFIRKSEGTAEHALGSRSFDIWDVPCPATSLPPQTGLQLPASLPHSVITVPTTTGGGLSTGQLHPVTGQAPQCSDTPQTPFVQGTVTISSKNHHGSSIQKMSVFFFILLFEQWGPEFSCFPGLYKLYCWLCIWARGGSLFLKLYKIWLPG